MNENLGSAILKLDEFAIEDFLKAGADPNALLPGEEFAPIHLGAGTSKSITQLLLKYGADPNARTSEGSTPLHIAASWGKGDVLKLLLKYGADMFIKDNEELDALGIAGKYKSNNCVHILQNHERKHEINIQSKKQKLTKIYNNDNDINNNNNKQIEINVYLNNIRLFSTVVSSSSSNTKVFENSGQNDKLYRTNPITIKTEDDAPRSKYKQPNINHEEFLNCYGIPNLISLSLSATNAQELTRNPQEDQCLNTKVEQEDQSEDTTGDVDDDNSVCTKMEYKKQEDDCLRKKPLYEFDKFSSVDIQSAETFFHRSTSSSQQTVKTPELRNVSHSKKRPVLSTRTGKEEPLLCRRQSKLKTEAEEEGSIYVDQESSQTISPSNTNKYALNLGSVLEGRTTEWQIRNWESNQNLIKQDRPSNSYQDSKLLKKNPDKIKKGFSSSPVQSERKMADKRESFFCGRSVKDMTATSTINKDNLQYFPCLDEETDSDPNCRSRELRREEEENRNNGKENQPLESSKLTSDDDDDDDDYQKMLNPEYSKCEELNNDAGVGVSGGGGQHVGTQLVPPLDLRTERSEEEAPPPKPQRFRKYNNNPYLQMAASIEERRKGLEKEKNRPMKKALHRISNCRFCQATKAIVTCLKNKILH